MRVAAACLAALLALMPMASRATAQYPDALLLDGEEVPILTNPLEGFLARHPQLRPEPSSSANWRGYVATFALRDGALRVVKVQVSKYERKGDEVEERTQDIMPTLFPGNEAVLADWYSGVLLVPRGRMLDYVHMGYGSTYERYTLLEIRAGKLVGRHEFTAEQFRAHRRKMFAAYRKTPDYARQLAESMESGLDARSAEDFIFEVESANYLTRSIEP